MGVKLFGSLRFGGVPAFSALSKKFLKEVTMSPIPLFFDKTEDFSSPAFDTFDNVGLLT